MVRSGIAGIQGFGKAGCIVIGAENIIEFHFYLPAFPHFYYRKSQVEVGEHFELAFFGPR